MMSRTRLFCVATSVLLALAFAVDPAQAQQGPPTVKVNVVEGTVGATQVGEWVTRSAEQPYTETVHPTCPFTNQCTATFAAVPAGKVLRVTSVHGLVSVSATATSGIFSLHEGQASLATAFFVRPLPPFSAAYYGNVMSLNEKVDIVFNAGEVPLLEVGANAAFFGTSSSRLGLSGTLSPAPTP